MRAGPWQCQSWPLQELRAALVNAVETATGIDINIVIYVDVKPISIIVEQVRVAGLGQPLGSVLKGGRLAGYRIGFSDNTGLGIDRQRISWSLGINEYGFERAGFRVNFKG